jgi:hypothetical protein
MPLTGASAFLSRYGAEAFPHREELLRRLAGGCEVVASSGASVSELRVTYRLRASHLENLVARGGVDEALSGLLVDCRALLNALNAPDAPESVGVWMVLSGDGVILTAVVDETAGRVLGCLRGYDQRLRPYAGLGDEPLAE